MLAGGSRIRVPVYWRLRSVQCDECSILHLSLACIISPVSYSYGVAGVVFGVVVFVKVEIHVMSVLQLTRKKYYSGWCSKSAMSLMLIVLMPGIAQSEVHYRESFDSRVKNSSAYQWGGGCFPYSVSFSDKIARIPGSSIRLEAHGDDKNDPTCSQMLENLPLNYDYGMTGFISLRSRNEIQHGVKVSQVNAFPLGSTNWYNFSVYFPSNEGTFSSWWRKSDRIIFGQVSGYGDKPGDSTVEVLFMIGNSGRVDVDLRYTTLATSVEQLKRNDGVAKLLPDTWNDIHMKVTRSHINGEVKIYINQSNVLSYVGPAAIKEFGYGRFKTGLYHADEVRKEVYVLYLDEVRVGSTEADVKMQPVAELKAPPTSPSLIVE